MDLAPAVPLTRSDLDALTELLEGRRVAVLTGAGCSTESGIPDYRGPETRRRARNPIQYKRFIEDPASRQRYWARAVVGWRKFDGKRPNAAHRALAELERAGVIDGVVTQNVDRLHQAGGSRNVVELHGALADVVCLGCGAMSERQALQAELERRNPGWVEAYRERAEMAPDGDAEIEDVGRFQVVDCARCGGPLKPHVVFFGEGVPKARVEAAWSLVDDADVLLVVGSSLAVYSGYRFVRGASKRGQPIAIVNLSESRGDPHAELLVRARAGDLLPELAARLAKGTLPQTA
ncbi:MAG: NAD-dependent protein deacetylase [Myxococcota bacterium]